MRIVSLQPSVSIVLDQLGSLDLLVACTKYCVEAVPSLAQLPVRIIHDSWSADTTEVLAGAPNLVLASVPYRMESLAAILKSGVTVVTFAPHTLADVVADIHLLGAIVNNRERAATVAGKMLEELETIRTRAAAAALHAPEKPLVYCEEWGKPLIHSQHWVDELIETAGGRTFGKAGITTDEQAIRDADPEIMIFAWCGAGDRVPLEKIVRTRGWMETRAVRSGRVFCITDEWLNTPAPSLVQGAWAIAAALHSGIFAERPTPRRLQAS